MTTYAPPRSSQDLNQFMANPLLAIPQYAEIESASYNYALHPHHGHDPRPYCAGPASFISGQCQTPRSMFDDAQMAPPHPCNTSVLSSPLVNHRPNGQPAPYFCHPVQQGPLSQSPFYSTAQDLVPLLEVENQESANENTMLSEPVLPPLEGFPSVKGFDQLVHSYVDGLSSKKQDKALIHAKRAKNIKAVLIDKKTTAVESAQFRFWAKKMFTLFPNDSRTCDRKKQICHEGKPVAIREKLFKILTAAHKQCQHGGRDKTSAQVRKFYSWVPKELISRFVKLCPTCQNRRGSISHTSSPSSSRNNLSDYKLPESPEIASLSTLQRQSMLMRHSPALSSSSNSTEMYGQQYHGGHWLSSAQDVNAKMPTHTQHPTTSMSQSSMVGPGHSGLPFNYTLSCTRDESLGPYRSYAHDFDTGHHYSQGQTF